MNKEELKASYELAGIYENLRHELHTPEERLERLERVEIALFMWANNPEETTEAETMLDGYGRECFALGYAQAQLDSQSVMGESRNRIYPKYKKLMEQFEAEAKEEEDAKTNNEKQED